jgi:hypothetical protein
MIPVETVPRMRGKRGIKDSFGVDKFKYDIFNTL